MKKFKYRAVSCRPQPLETTLNRLGELGFKLFHVQPIYTITGVGLQEAPKSELSYNLIFEKEIENETP